MKLNFVKMNPAGNTTIFVLDQIPRELHGQIAQTLMKPEYLCADQVGFIEKPYSSKAAVRLQMMGGEFCGNAARALAALLTDRGHSKIRFMYPSSDTAFPQALIPLEISGCEDFLEATVKRDKIHYWVEVPVPAPQSVQKIELIINGKAKMATLVEFSGITHVVLSDVAPDQAVFQEVARQVGQTDALGLMFYDPENQFLTPLVAVVKAKTLVWEGSCASGTVAVAADRACELGHDCKDLVVKQPGGLITVDIEYNLDKPGQARIKGPVEFIAEGTVCLP